MDLCRVNERNAAALTLTSIGQQPSSTVEQEIVTTSQPSGTVQGNSGGQTTEDRRIRDSAGTTWLVVDSNNAEHAATTVVQQEQTIAHPEPNNNVGPVTSNDVWTKQPTVLEDGSVIYTDVVSQNSSGEGIVTQSM